MIVWLGFGFLIFIAAIGFSVAVQGIVDAIYGAGYYSDHHKMFFPLAMVLAAACVYLLYEEWLKKKEAPRELIDEKTGDKVTLHRQSSLFFIPFRYWTYILLGIGVLSFFINK